MATWDSTLPQEFNAQGFSLTQEEQTVRTSMDAGPDFVRRRFTATITNFSGMMIIDATQYTTFWDFFNNTINGGSDEFAWVHPVTGASATIRFTKVPSISAISDKYFQLSLSGEVLP